MPVQHGIQHTTDGGFEITFIVTVARGDQWNAELRAAAVEVERVRVMGALADRLAKAGAKPSVLSVLTPRQSEVCALVLDGKSNAEIAHTLVLSVFTVQSHVSHIFDALDVRSRAELISRYGGV